MRDLGISAQFIKGVGPSRFKILNRLEILTVEDLLYYVPRRYEDRSKIKTISEGQAGNFETLKARVLTLGERTTKKGINIFRMAVGDTTGVIYAVWFNQPYMKDRFKVGDELILYGKLERYDLLQVNNPDYEIIKDTKPNSIHIGRIVPIYPLTEGVNQRWFRTIIKFSIDHYINGISDILPYEIRRKNNLIALREAIRNIHFPVSDVVLEKAKERIIFDEFLLLQLGITLRRTSIKMDLAGYSHNIEGGLIEEFKKKLPFEFTKAQQRVIREIESDMKSPKPMNRLLQGDVGSGKTIVALYALVLAVQNKYQGALMVPTELLSGQHYKNITQLLEGLDIKVLLLSGDLKPEEKTRRRYMIETGAVDIVVGTHAIIQEGVRFKRLSLAVIDEQHKFGVMQRANLRSKSLNPDIMVMTATPIPRTLALTLYGDLDISIIDELPPGRKSIKTLYFKGNDREKAYRILGEQVKIGRQVYVVYPIIEESEKTDIRAAVGMHKKLKDFFPKLKIGLLHGRMRSSEKERIMQDFKEHRIDILVSTIVIEVGIDIQNASTMLIEHAELFGLSQLHQLRGRIGRGEYVSYCILVADPDTDEAKQRLSAMLKTSDGFKLAEEDLAIRGPGEFFGTRQHGLPELKIGNIVRDRKLLELAKGEAVELIKKDRFLTQAENKFIRENLKRKFRWKELELAGVG